MMMMMTMMMRLSLQVKILRNLPGKLAGFGAQLARCTAAQVTAVGSDTSNGTQYQVLVQVHYTLLQPTFWARYYAAQVRTRCRLGALQFALRLRCTPDA